MWQLPVRPLISKNSTNYGIKSHLAASEVECTLDIHQQRIVFSTLSYVVFDLMVDKIKDYKVTDFKQSGVKNSRASSKKSTITLKESNVNLYRYGGFALHLIQKRTKSVKDKPIDSCLQMELRFLRHLSLPKYRERSTNSYCRVKPKWASHGNTRSASISTATCGEDGIKSQ